jgi:heme exporter protein B
MSRNDRLFHPILATLQRELLLGLRNPGAVLNPLFFFVIATSLFPLGGSANPEWLGSIAPGVIWVMALLSVMLSMESLFRNDFEDGSLEVLLLSPQPLYFHVLMKVVGHWLLSGLPIAVLSPLLAYMLALPTVGYYPLIYGLLLGTPTLSLIGAIGTALTVGIGRSGLLLAVIVLPLCIPVLVFGAGLVETALVGLPVRGIASVMGAMLVGAVIGAPLAISAALRISVN